jgi:hypothetical protein
MRNIYEDDSLSYEKAAFRRPAEGIDVELDCSQYINEESDTVEVEKPWDLEQIQ